MPFLDTVRYKYIYRYTNKGIHMDKRNKILKSFRLHPQDIDCLVKTSEESGFSQTNILERALWHYFNNIAEGKEILIATGSGRKHGKQLQ